MSRYSRWKRYVPVAERRARARRQAAKLAERGVQLKPVEVQRTIRDGAWSYDQLVEHAEVANRTLDRILAEGRAVVPPGPDRDAVDRLCVDVLETAVRDGL